MFRSKARVLRNVKGNGVVMLGGIYCFEEYIANADALFVGQQYVKILERWERALDVMQRVGFESKGHILYFSTSFIVVP